MAIENIMAAQAWPQAKYDAAIDIHVDAETAHVFE